MKHLRIFSMLFILVSAGAFAIPAYAGSDSVQIKKSDDPNSITRGELRFRLNSDYCKVLLDGDEWDDQEFYRNGKAVVLYGIDRTQPHTVKLIPAYPDLAPVEFKITPKMWKVVRFKPGVKVWRVAKSIHFRKKKAEKKKGKK